MTADQRTQRINELRERHELTPQQIADLMRRSVPTVYGWLNGTYPITEHGLELLEVKLTGSRSAHDSQ